VWLGALSLSSVFIVISNVIDFSVAACIRGRISSFGATQYVVSYSIIFVECGVDSSCLAHAGHLYVLSLLPIVIISSNIVLSFLKSLPAPRLCVVVARSRCLTSFVVQSADMYMSA